MIGANRRYPALRAAPKFERQLYAPSAQVGGALPPLPRSDPDPSSASMTGSSAAPSPVRSSAGTATIILLVRVPLHAVSLWLPLLPASCPHFSSLPALLLPVERNVASTTAPGSGMRPGPAQITAMPPRRSIVIPRSARRRARRTLTSMPPPRLLSDTSNPPASMPPQNDSIPSELIRLHSCEYDIVQRPPVHFLRYPCSSRYETRFTSLITASAAIIAQLTVSCPPRLPLLSRFRAAASAPAS